jgi:hypothetical protein
VEANAGFPRGVKKLELANPQRFMEWTEGVFRASMFDARL